jgi:parallel beta-helix repeat protein
MCDVQMNSAKLVRLRTGFAVAFMLVLLGTLVLQFNVQPVRADPKTIVVPEEYPTISEAVTHASSGDTVFVQSGIYHENVWIDKSLLILGEDSENTVVIGEGGANSGNVFTLAADSITVSGFTIRSVDYTVASQYANGVNIEGDNCTVQGNNISNTFWGVLCAIQSSTSITQNNITRNLKEGIRFYGGSLNTISGNYIGGNKASGVAIEGYSNVISRNTVINNTRGIGLGSSYSVVFGNLIADNGESGIYFAGSNNTIAANHISNSGWAIYFPSFFGAPNGNKFIHNNFVDNSQNVYVSSTYNVNYWDDGAEGNYWSNYATENPDAKEVDDSGTGDVPFVICANNVDNHPLINPYDINSVSVLPTAEQPPMPKGHVVSLWHFDEVKPNNITADAMGCNDGFLGAAAGNVIFTPSLVKGKFGNALSFDGWAYVYVPASPSLEIRGEITFDAWIYMNEFKNVTYNNIVIQSVREDKNLPNRIAGLAVNGVEPADSTSPSIGALRGYVVTETEGLNEIVTTEPVIHLKERTHVVFTRSLTSGMHLHVNGKEEAVRVTEGTQNPTGNIKRSTYLYIGHDSNALIDELSIGNTAMPPTATFLGLQEWLWAVITAGALISVGTCMFIYFKKRKK